MTAKNLFFKQFNYNRFFIETGSCEGWGIQNALDSGFKYVYSIELAEKYYNMCRGRFITAGNVRLFHGDSVKILPKLIEAMTEPVTFWLDGHSSGGDTAKGEGYKIDGFPVFEELEIIGNHTIKTHTILIDDISPTPDSDWVRDIEEVIKAINDKYVIRYERGAQAEGYILIAEVPRDK